MGYDARTRVLTVPSGSLLDLGATGKAFAADVIAARLAQQLPGGFLVNLGGDIAVSGELPGDGWEIGVEDHHGVTRQVVVSRGQAVATFIDPGASVDARRRAASSHPRSPHRADRGVGVGAG